MKFALYSDAQIDVARQLFPERFEQPGWFDRQWTDEELEACKSLGTKEFIERPCAQTFPWKLYARDDAGLEKQAIGIVDRHLDTCPNAKRVLSIGCGGGWEEIWLAMRHPELEVVAIDNAPYVEGLNQVALERKVNNINFRNVDLRRADLGVFDIVYSMAVIYCVPDEFLTSYFEVIASHMKSDGIAIVGSAANLSLMQKARYVVKRKPRKGYKQTGWMRDWQEVKQYIPESLEVVNRSYFHHDGQIPSFLKRNAPAIAKLIAQFSENVYPISSSCFAIYLRNRQQS